MPANRTRVPALALAAVLAGAVLTGCGSAPERIDPSGVDGLVIPAPEIDTHDFDDPRANDWFPLEPGSVSLFRHEGETLATETELSVLDDDLVIAGVATTPIRTVVRSADEVLTETTSWYAADDRGNVWLFGQEVTALVDGRPKVQSSWKAGVGRAEAGLVMPAVPRVGDGFAAGSDKGRPVGRIEVLDLVGSVRVPAGDFEDVVTVSVAQQVLPGITETRSYARDVGLVRAEQSGNAFGEMELAERRG
ncbi:hypothetical protein BJ980_003131 [Nocardioides daedukensis]|uniref:Uncharacterized protein n=1 Tax=Nocardioides daedukensis TaxID=634462 RepID=A0A7Y9UQ19_9ACTN|nr:hypothetical protein [Nocardioides daedukensis]NYG60208.1 hypothetical protein [Nocardioides daedukensis]